MRTVWSKGIKQSEPKQNMKAWWMMYQRVKQRVFAVIEAERCGKVSLASKLFASVIFALIAVSIFAVFVLTFDLPVGVQKFFAQVECGSVVIFSAEYLVRLWTADLLYPALPHWRARIRYIRSGLALIDLVSILPYFIPYVLPVNLLGLRSLRLFRLLRILKMRRYTDSLTAITSVLKQKSYQLLVSMSLVSVLLLIASLLMYHLENGAQPDKFVNAFSGFWWAVVTLTTVGYGDIYPITVGGRLLGAMIAILGIGMVAIPTSILSAGFVEGLSKRSKAESKSNVESDGIPINQKELEKLLREIVRDELRKHEAEKDIRKESI